MQIKNWHSSIKRVIRVEHTFDNIWVYKRENCQQSQLGLFWYLQLASDAPVTQDTTAYALLGPMFIREIVVWSEDILLDTTKERMEHSWRTTKEKTPLECLYKNYLWWNATYGRWKGFCFWLFGYQLVCRKTLPYGRSLCNHHDHKGLEEIYLTQMIVQTEPDESTPSLASEMVYFQVCQWSRGCKA